MPFDPPVPRDWTNRITCNGWLFLPGWAWAPNFLNESLKWWFVLEYQEDWSPSLLKLASWREYRKQHAPNFNHYPSGLLHDPLGAGSGGRTALFFLLLCDQPDQLVSKHIWQNKNALLTVFTESSEESHPTNVLPSEVPLQFLCGCNWLQQGGIAFKAFHCYLATQEAISHLNALHSTSVQLHLRQDTCTYLSLPPTSWEVRKLGNCNTS